VKRDELRFESVDGGQYDSVPIAQVPTNGHARMLNFIPRNKRAELRSGTVQFSRLKTLVDFEPNAALPVRELAHATGELATWAAVTASTKGQFALLHQSGAWEPAVIPDDLGASFVEDEMPWLLRTRVRRVYASRRGSGRIKRIEADGWTDAGRPAPILPLTLTPIYDVAPGPDNPNLPDGTYLVSYTYVDSETGFEGNGSPEATVVVDQAGVGFPILSIQVSSFVPAPSWVRWDKYGIYMSRIDGAVLFRVANVASDTTAYNITSQEDASGEQLATDNDLPPETQWFDFWNERTWWITEDGKSFGFSPIGRYESFSAANAFEFDKNDGDKIQVIYSWGKYMVVAKRRKMMLFTGYDRQTWDKDTWTDVAGCVAPFSMRDCEGTLVWLSESGFMSATPDARPKNISNLQVKAALAFMDQDRRDLAYAEIVPSLTLYVCAFPLMDGSWQAVALNYQTGAWSEMAWTEDVRSIHFGYEDSERTRVFATARDFGEVLWLFEGTTDLDGDIRGLLRSGAPRIGEAGERSTLREVSVVSSPTRYPVTLRVFGDNRDTVLETGEYDLEGDFGWKQMGLIGRYELQSQLQVQLEYSGRDPFFVSEISWGVLTSKAMRTRH